jgi:hypothetical protein
MRYIFFYWLVLLGCTTTNEPCKIDEDFRDEYFNCLNIVAVAARDTVGTFKVRTTELIQAINCLDSITNHQNQMRFEEVGFAVYESVEQFNLDLKAWLEWYQINRCTYTLTFAENLMKRKRDKFPNYFDKKVMDSLGRIWYRYEGDSIRIIDSLSIISTGLYWPARHPEIQFIKP